MLMVGPMGGRRGPATEKAKNYKGTLLHLARYIAQERFKLVLAVLFAIASVAFNVCGPRILGNATTELYRGVTAKIMGTGAINFDELGRLIALALAVYICAALCNLVQGWFMTGVSQRACYRLRREIIAKVDRMPLGYFERGSVGDVLSRVTNDVDTLSQSLNQSITTLVTSTAQVIGVAVQMISLSVMLAGIAFATVPLSFIAVAVMVRVSQKYFRRQQSCLGQANGIIEESFSGQNVIQVFNARERAVEAFDEVNSDLYDSGWRSQFLSGLMSPIMGFASNLGYVGVVVAGAFLAVDGTIAIGDVQAFTQYVRNFARPLQQLSQVSSVLQMLSAAAERVFEFLEESEEDNAAQTPGPTEQAGTVEFKHARFGYVPEKTIIRDFSRKIEPGQTVAIVGPSGSGKSTLMKLPTRFYDVDDGSIEVNGIDVRSYSREDLRRNFSMVLQETWLFKGSVRENIRYGNAEATDEQVEEAARAALADRFIRQLPGGYDFELNENASNVSQGQKQLLTIARAILADRPILVLDEATSNVDTSTEERIQRAMDNLMAGRTSFVVAHRLSTIKGADVILVLCDGDVAESGTHEELLAQGGIYADLYKSQF